MTKSKGGLHQDQVNPEQHHMRWMMLAFVGAAAISAVFPVRAQPLRGDPASGRQIATAQCSSCHLVLPMLFPDRGETLHVDKDGPPSFQSIADMTSTTGLSLNVFFRSNHKNMPNLILSQAEADDIIAYILSLKKK